jgi:DNA polymerase-1
MKQQYETPVRIKTINSTWRDGLELVQIKTTSQLEAALAEMHGKTWAADTETTGLDFETLEIVGFSFCAHEKKAYYVPVSHRFGDNIVVDTVGESGREVMEGVSDKSHWCVDNEAVQTAVAMFVKAIQFSENPVLFYNTLYDTRVLRKYGLSIPDTKSFDVMALVWNTDTNVPLPSLKKSILRFCGITAPTFSDTLGESVTIRDIDADAATQYAACDPLFTLMLAKTLYGFYQKNKDIVDMDNRFLEPLREMMDTPQMIDKDLAQADAAQVQMRIAELAKMIYASVGREFSINSPAQVGRVLAELGIDTGARTETTGLMATGIKEITPIKDKHPVLPLIIEYKETVKHLSSYVEPFIECYRADLGGFRIQYQAYKVPTARLSSGIGQKEKPGYYAKLNWQSTPSPVPMMYDAVYNPDAPDHVLGWQFKPHPPKRDGSDDPGGPIESGDPKWNVRNYAVCADDEWIVEFDFIAEEINIAGNLSGDPAFLEPLGRGEDLHKYTAVQMWGIERYNKVLRKLAKNANFNLQYLGMPAMLLHIVQQEDQTATLEQMEEVYEKWWNLHGAQVSWRTDRYGRRWPDLIHRSGLAAWHKRMQESAKKVGYFKTAMGRIRHVGYWYNSRNRRDWGFADRTVANGPVQGLAGDIMRYVFCNIHYNLYRNPEFGPWFKYMHSLHDSFAFRVKRLEPHFTRVVNGIETQLTALDVLKFKVPLKVDMSVGRKWGTTFGFVWHADRQAWVPKGAKL